MKIKIKKATRIQRGGHSYTVLEAEVGKSPWIKQGDKGPELTLRGKQAGFEIVKAAPKPPALEPTISFD